MVAFKIAGGGLVDGGMTVGGTYTVKQLFICVKKLYLVEYRLTRLQDTHEMFDSRKLFRSHLCKFS